MSISIHALLAESDKNAIANLPSALHFYPRSPCGERPMQGVTYTPLKVFLSTLSLRRATPIRPAPVLPPRIFLSTLSLRRATPPRWCCGRTGWHFYPRSPCGERHIGAKPVPIVDDISIHALLAESDHHGVQQADRRSQFLSTLSLRRATPSHCWRPPAWMHFYPRSPCGERLSFP